MRSSALTFAFIFIASALSAQAPADGKARIIVDIKKVDVMTTLTVSHDSVRAGLDHGLSAEAMTGACEIAPTLDMNCINLTSCGPADIS